MKAILNEPMFNNVYIIRQQANLALILGKQL